MSAVDRYVRHAKRFGIEGLFDAATRELHDRDLERLRQLLVREGVKVPNRPRKPNDDGAKALQNRGRKDTGQDDSPEGVPGRTCAVCGRGLGGKHWHSKTCSARCRVALHRRHGGAS